MHKPPRAPCCSNPLVCKGNEPMSLPDVDDVELAAAAVETGACWMIAVAIGTASSRPPQPRRPEDCGGRMSTAAAAKAGLRAEEMAQLLRAWGLASTISPNDFEGGN